jgi:hypothetical protein
MWPKIPDNIQSLTAAALRELSREIKKVATGVLLAADSTAEQLAEAHTFLAQRDEFIALAKTKDASAATAAALAADDDDEDPAPAPVVETPAPVVEDPAPVVEDEELSTRPVVTTFGGTPAAGTAVVPVKPQSTLEQLFAKDGLGSKRAGDTFESWQELALAAVARAENIRAASGERFAVAGIKANYPEERRLGDSASLNMAMFEPDEIQAALCAPATPYYGIACANTLVRPVFNSMPQFQAPRMKVSIMPSPSLSDIVTGVAQWSAANEASSNAQKLAPQKITCGNPTEYQMYGVYRSLTVRNMLAMSYPELVEAWLNRLGAAHARLAEQLLLNAMYSATTEIAAPRLGYGGTTSILSTILNYLALYQETQRWDSPGMMKAWIPRWVLWAIKMDLIRRRQVTGVAGVPSDGYVSGLFSDVGFDVTWILDTPSYAVAIPPVASGGNLNLLPATVQILCAPAGKFALMDRGELSIGVTGNNIYRDNASNSANEFTFFFENFEGVVSTNSCPAHTLNIPVQWNGVQIDDIVINAQGGDEVGYQS